jgi:hypothetical protein
MTGSMTRATSSQGMEPPSNPERFNLSWILRWALYTPFGIYRLGRARYCLAPDQLPMLAWFALGLTAPGLIVKPMPRFLAFAYGWP